MLAALARVLELADRHGSGPCVRKDVRVQISSLAQFNVCRDGGIGIRDSLRSYARKGVGVRVPLAAQEFYFREFAQYYWPLSSIIQKLREGKTKSPPLTL